MQEKQYMIVFLPKTDEAVGEQDLKTFTDYDDAFLFLNSYISERTEQLYQRPRREKPLRIALEHEYVELWIINRTNEIWAV